MEDRKTRNFTRRKGIREARKEQNKHNEIVRDLGKGEEDLNQFCVCKRSRKEKACTDSLKGRYDD
jgi:hypothetical protein